MGKNFIEASTEIDDLISQKNDIMKKIANDVSSAILDRVNNNKLTGLTKDVDNLLRELSDTEKYQVMLLVSMSLAKNKAAGGNKNSHSSSSSRGSLFDRF